MSDLELRNMSKLIQSLPQYRWGAMGGEMVLGVVRWSGWLV